MDVTIIPTKLKGMITPPPSKSQAHRLVIAAALSEGESLLTNVAFSQDILATLHAMEALGAAWEQVGADGVRIRGIAKGASCGQLPHIDCGESGSTLRFLIPIALAVAGGGVFTGRGRLMQRPQKPYFDLFEEKGIAYTFENEVLTVRGTLPAGEYCLPGDVSSQFFTGLLYALSLVEGESTIRSTTALESRSYIDMTIDALAKSGVTVEEAEDPYPVFKITGGQPYHFADCAVEADWSQAGFYFAALGMGNDVEITGMDARSVQGDKKIAPYYIALTGDGEVTLDVSDCPDLVPPLAAHAALRGAGKVTHIVNAARLRIKESDRLTAVTTVLNALGADVRELPDGLVIHGADRLLGGTTVDSFNDHRIAMMSAMAATRCVGAVTITDAGCVKKSYPHFWEDYETLGGMIRREEKL